MIVAGTGSRRFTPDAFRGIDDLVDEYVATFSFDSFPVTLMSGMAEGWDEYIARTAMRYGWPLIAAVPNDGYGHYYWGQTSLSGRNRETEFMELLDYAESTGGIKLVCDNAYEGRTHSNLIRNQWMVDHADAFVVLDPMLGGIPSKGTQHCFRLIRKTDKPYRVFGNQRGIATVIGGRPSPLPDLEV